MLIYNQGVLIIDEIINLIVNNGVSVGVVVYFLYRDNKFLANLQSTLTALENTTNSINKLLIEIRGDKDDNK